MTKLDFLTTVTQGDLPFSFPDKILSAVDGYLHLDCLGCKRVEVIGPGKVVLRNQASASWLATVLKVVTYALLIPVLVALVLKVLFRCVGSWTLVQQPRTRREHLQPTPPIQKNQTGNWLAQKPRVLRRQLDPSTIHAVANHLFNLTDPSEMNRLTTELKEIKSLTLKQLQEYRKALSLLKREKKGNPTFCDVLHFCKNLVKLDLQMGPLLLLEEQKIKTEEFQEIWAYLKQGNLSLQSLLLPQSAETTDAFVTEIACRFPLLTHLHLSNCQQLEGRALPSAAFPHLQELSIQNAPHLTSEALRQFLQNSPLIHLALDRCPLVADFSGSFSSLQTLKLSACDHLSAQGLNCLLSAPNLKELALIDCANINLSELEWPALSKLEWVTLDRMKGCQILPGESVQSLSVKWCYQFTGSDCIKIFSSGRLRNLQLARCPSFGKIPQPIPSNLTHLESISLELLKSFTDDDLAWLLSGENVTHLQLTRCERLTGSKIEQGAVQNVQRLVLSELLFLKGPGLAALLAGGNVKELSIEACHLLDADQCHLEHLSQLTHLTLSSLLNLSSNGLALLLSAPRLHTLSLDLGGEPGTLSLSSEITLPELSSLKLAGASQLTPKAFWTLISSPQLHSLFLTGKDFHFFTREERPYSREIRKRFEEFQLLTPDLPDFKMNHWIKK